MGGAGRYCAGHLRMIDAGWVCLLRIRYCSFATDRSAGSGRGTREKTSSRALPRYEPM